MKEQNMTIDINKLCTIELQQLASMFYSINKMEEVKQINERIAFIEGQMSEKKSLEYRKKYC